MRKLLFAIVLFGVALLLPKLSKAQYGYHNRNSSELKIKMYDNSMFVVIFDRRKYETPTSFFRLSEIRPGNHRIIIKRKYGRYGSEYTVYRGDIYIPARSIVKAGVNKYNRLVIKRIVPIYDDGDYVDPDYYHKPNLDMARLRHSLNRASFDSDKQRIAKQAISTHRVRANQIYQILMMFSFEDSKVKLAKFAYKYCVDKRNYYLVNDAFTFSSSIRELDDFIRHNNYNNYDDNWDSYNRDYYDNTNRW
ncbi:MAG: DUF4476 domain-containing protein [Chlorobi bacterium]|nr:DUF4476 domain-containing protein [Chlorobiota bacterium]